MKVVTPTSEKHTKTLEKCPCGSNSSMPFEVIGELPDVRVFAGKIHNDLPASTLWRCTRCRSLFRQPRMQPRQLLNLYFLGSEDAWTGETDRPDFDTVINYLAKSLPHGGKILEIGCGCGILLSKLCINYRCTGVEPNENSRSKARAASGAPVFGSIEEISVDAKFDCVILIDVIEHLLDPLEFFRNVSGRLTARGTILVTTGNASHWYARLFRHKWWYVSYPEHVLVLSEPWFRNISREVGLSLVECARFNRLRISPLRKLLAAASGALYLVAPALTQGLCNLFLGPRLQGNPRAAFGAGVGRDHIFIALAHAERDSAQARRNAALSDMIGAPRPEESDAKFAGSGSTGPKENPVHL